MKSELLLICENQATAKKLRKSLKEFEDQFILIQENKRFHFAFETENARDLVHTILSKAKEKFNLKFYTQKLLTKEYK